MTPISDPTGKSTGVSVALTMPPSVSDKVEVRVLYRSESKVYTEDQTAALWNLSVDVLHDRLRKDFNVPTTVRTELNWLDRDQQNIVLLPVNWTTRATTNGRRILILKHVDEDTHPLHRRTDQSSVLKYHNPKGGAEVGSYVLYSDSALSVMIDRCDIARYGPGCCQLELSAPVDITGRIRLLEFCSELANVCHKLYDMRQYLLVHEGDRIAKFIPRYANPVFRSGILFRDIRFGQSEFKLWTEPHDISPYGLFHSESEFDALCSEMVEPLRQSLGKSPSLDVKKLVPFAPPRPEPPITDVKSDHHQHHVHTTPRHVSVACDTVSPITTTQAQPVPAPPPTLPLPLSQPLPLLPIPRESPTVASPTALPSVQPLVPFPEYNTPAIDYTLGSPLQ